jgi:hypothetical protein
VVLTLSSLAFAGDEVPRPLKAAIILRSVAYEQGVAQRSGAVVIAVVGGSSSDSSDDAKAMASVFAKLLENTRIAERAGRVVRIVHDSNAKTVKEIQAHRAEIIYFAPGLESLIPAVPGSSSTILVCGQGDDMKNGCTLGVELSGDKPRLVLNLPQANRTGLRFEPQLLRLARVIR